MDPTDTEERFCSTKAPGMTGDHGIIVQAVLPQHDQISEMFMIGSIDMNSIERSMELMNDAHKNICPILEQCLVKTVFETFPNSKKTDKE